MRSIAIIMMVIYHTAFDLAEFYHWDINVYEGGWGVFRTMTATLFLVLVGIGFVISFNKSVEAKRFASTDFNVYKKYFRRGMSLIALGMLLSLGSYLHDPTTYIRFGILHLIGVSILLLPFFARFKEWNVPLGFGIIVTGTTIYRHIDVSSLPTIFTPLFTIIGLPSPSFATLDYYPLLPWFGVVLIGVAIGNFVYIRHTQWRRLLPSIFNFVGWPGRHALLLYFIHQPIIVLILTTLLGIPQLGNFQ